MKRRHLLAGLAGTALVPLGPSVAQAWQAGGPELASRLVAALDRPGSAIEVGLAYLRQHQDEADRARVTMALAPDLERHCEPEKASRAELRTAISRQVRHDFELGRVAEVDGWILSVTEARLCALAALHAT